MSKLFPLTVTFKPSIDCFIAESESFRSWTYAFRLFSASVALLISLEREDWISWSFKFKSAIDSLVESLRFSIDSFIAVSSAFALAISESILLLTAVLLVLTVFLIVSRTLLRVSSLWVILSLVPSTERLFPIFLRILCLSL